MTRRELRLFHKIADYAHKYGVDEIRYDQNTGIMSLRYGLDRLAFYPRSWASTLDAIDDWINEKHEKYGNKNSIKNVERV